MTPKQIRNTTRWIEALLKSDRQQVTSIQAAIKALGLQAWRWQKRPLVWFKTKFGEQINILTVLHISYTSQRTNAQVAEYLISFVPNSPAKEKLRERIVAKLQQDARVAEHEQLPPLTLRRGWQTKGSRLT